MESNQIIFANNDMGHFTLTDQNYQMISQNQLYDLVLRDIKMSFRDGIISYQTILNQPIKTYHLSNQRYTVDFSHLY